MMLLRFVLPVLAAVMFAVGCGGESSEEVSLTQTYIPTTVPEPTSLPVSSTTFSEAGLYSERAWFELVDEAAGVCSGERSVYPSGCGPAVWQACYAAQWRYSSSPEIGVWSDADSDDYSLGSTVVPERPVVELERDRDGTVRLLCNIARIAETSKLAYALAYRYGSEYYSYEWTDRGYSSDPPTQYPFYLFHESRLYWQRYLDMYIDPSAFCDRPCIITADSVWGWLDNVRNFRHRSGSTTISDNTMFVVDPLIQALKDVFRRYTQHSARSILAPLPPLPTLLTDPTEVSPVLPSEVSQVCQDAIIAARLDTEEWLLDIRQCVVSAELCEADGEVTVSIRDDCADAGSEADFERLWQQLPQICIAAGKAAALDASDDPCSSAAEELCWHPHRQYQGFSIPDVPDNPAEDFSCAAARANPYAISEDTVL